MPPNSDNSTIENPADEMNPPDPNTFIVKYRKNYYDITQFLHKHPGGINTLKGLQNSDMTARFMKAPPHSDAAMYLMKEYQMNTEQMVTQELNGKHITNIKENIEIVEEECDDEDVADKTNNNNINSMDESMEVSLALCVYYLK